MKFKIHVLIIKSIYQMIRLSFMRTFYLNIRITTFKLLETKENIPWSQEGTISVCHSTGC